MLSLIGSTTTFKRFSVQPMTFVIFPSVAPTYQQHMFYMSNEYKHTSSYSESGRTKTATGLDPESIDNNASDLAFFGFKQSSPTRHTDISKNFPS